MSRARILVVDDDEQIRRVMRMTLSAQGYEVSDAPNGDEALERMRAGRFDLGRLGTGLRKRGGVPEGVYQPTSKKD